MRAINRAEPGLIRVDADETTYSLHIILRFELEQQMIEGSVALAHDAAPGSVLVDSGVLAVARDSYPVGPPRRLASGAITAHVLVARPEQRIERTLAGFDDGLAGASGNDDRMLAGLTYAREHGMTAPDAPAQSPLVGLAKSEG